MDLQAAENIINFYHNVSDLIGMPSGLKYTLAESVLNPNFDLNLIKSILGQSSEGWAEIILKSILAQFNFP